MNSLGLIALAIVCLGLRGATHCARQSLVKVRGCLADVGVRNGAAMLQTSISTSYYLATAAFECVAIDLISYLQQCAVVF